LAIIALCMMSVYIVRALRAIPAAAVTAAAAAAAAVIAAVLGCCMLTTQYI
jgi:hypothetical protein